jgi:hypothetical protein
MTIYIPRKYADRIPAIIESCQELAPEGLEVRTYKKSYVTVDAETKTAGVFALARANACTA